MPKQTDVAGTYVLGEKSSDFLVHEKGYGAVLPRSAIVLSSNGEATVENIPDCYAIISVTDQHHAFLSGRGKWLIEGTDTGYGVTLDIAPGGSMPAGIYHASSILLRGKSMPFQLQLGIGDPDSNEWLVFGHAGS